MPGSLLALDPSSTAIGWCQMGPGCELRSAGVIRPGREHRKTAFDRITDMTSALAALLHYATPSTILIEWTVGKVAGRLKRKSRGAGLAIYGIGVGAATATCQWYAHKRFEIEIVEIEAITENTWTRGVPKEARQAWIAGQFKQYRATDDPGGDMADAIGLAQWWLQERKMKGNTSI